MVEFARNVARFSATDIGILGDFLEDMIESFGTDVEEDEKRVIEGFLDAIEDCDSIEIVDDEEFLPSAL